MAQRVKNSPAMQEIWVQSLGQEDPLDKGMATYSSILAWRIGLAQLGNQTALGEGDQSGSTELISP